MDVRIGLSQQALVRGRNRWPCPCSNVVASVASLAGMAAWRLEVTCGRRAHMALAIARSLSIAGPPLADPSGCHQLSVIEPAHAPQHPRASGVFCAFGEGMRGMPRCRCLLALAMYDAHDARMTSCATVSLRINAALDIEPGLALRESHGVCATAAIVAKWRAHRVYLHAE